MDLALVSLKKLAWHPASGVCLATAAWKQIFCLCLRVSHTEWCETPGVLMSFWGAMGLFVVPTTVTHGGLFTYPPTLPSIMNYDWNVGLLTIISSVEKVSSPTPVDRTLSIAVRLLQAWCLTRVDDV